MKTVLSTFVFFLIVNSNQAMDHVIEIRSYNLKPGTREHFHQIVNEEAIPMLKRWNLSVVSYGPSLHDANSYYLVREYASVDEMNKSEDAFYGSEEWKKGPRERILSMIDNYVTIVVSRDFFERALNPGGDPLADPGSDLSVLSELNKQFIRNYVNMDSAAHGKIISKDFVCIENSGAIVGREAYLKDWATSYRDSKFTSFASTEEFIRIFGNTALVRSKSYYTKTAGGKTIKGESIYTDTYVKQNGKWTCVQAQITPVVN